MPDQPPPRRRFQFRLRTLMIVVTLLAVPLGYVGWRAKIVRARHEAFKLLEARGGLWRSPANSMFPGPVQSSFNQMLGDIPPQKYIFLGDDQQFTETEILRIKQLFPEADSVEIIAPRIDDRTANTAEPWPTAEENARYAAGPNGW